MNYLSHFEQKIDFIQIRKLVSDVCISDMGRYYVSRMKFTTQQPLLEKWLRQIAEFSSILKNENSFPSQNYFDLRDELKRLKTLGTFIQKETLFDLTLSLETLNEIISFFKKTEENELLELKELIKPVIFPDSLYKKAHKIIDHKGNIRDNASEKLSEIRKLLINKQKKIMKETRKVFQQAKESKWTDEKAEITIRNGRWVIPVKATDKRAFRGVIHDESSTGQTVFIEPLVSFEINNEIRELENEELREIIRILTLFTDHLRLSIDALNEAYRVMGLLDFIRAKAIFGLKIKASTPHISDKKKLELRNGMHPLLFLAHQSNGKEIVPLNINLDEENRIVVISGPNAGGKSVCLKTVGLLQYMLQCGLPISASPDSHFRLFDQIFLDIGDEQSLENDLSTYSSHLINMKHFIKNANENSLILIDELGTGTEPQLGGAIAEAVMEQFSRKKTYGIITTHYSNLKIAADRLDGFINGAMLFDVEELKPLYLLKIGQPGSSFAFEIAKKIGFPKTVIQRAKKKSGSQHLRFDIQLQQLEADKLSFSEQQKKLNQKELELNSLLEQYSTLKDKLQIQKKEIIQQAESTALNIISNANKEVEKTIREIKEAQADKEKTKISRQKLEKTKKALTLKIDQKNNPENRSRLKQNKVIKEKTHPVKQPIDNNIRPGDFVLIKNTGTIGTVILINEKESQIEVNGKRLTLSPKNIEKTLQKPLKQIKQKNYSGIVNSVNQSISEFKLTLDLRGKRSEEALETLQKYIDDAIVFGIKEVSILHGKGFGILREILREYLLSVKEIKHFGDAPVDKGGAGITLITFK